MATTVASSNDGSCFKATNATPDFFFYISTVTQIVQCQDIRIWWVPTTVQGYVFSMGLALVLLLIYITSCQHTKFFGPHSRWTIVRPPGRRDHDIPNGHDGHGVLVATESGSGNDIPARRRRRAR